MPKTRAYAALSPTTPLVPFEIDRREPGPTDVLIDIAYCGVCHSDLHQVRDEWGGSHLPDGAGPRDRRQGRRASAAAVKRFKVGDLVGRGLHGRLLPHLRQLPARPRAVLREGRGLHLQRHRDGPEDPDLRRLLDAASWWTRRSSSGSRRSWTSPAPRRCSAPASPPTRRSATGRRRQGDQVGVVGLGGLGHMAVKLAAAMGAEVTMLSTSKSKEADARRLGAHRLRAHLRRRPPSRSWRGASISSSTPSPRRTTTTPTSACSGWTAPWCCWACPPSRRRWRAFALIGGRRRPGRLAHRRHRRDPGDARLLRRARHHRPTSRSSRSQKVNEAYDRMLKNDVRYRFVLDMATL